MNAGRRKPNPPPQVVKPGPLQRASTGRAASDKERAYARQLADEFRALQAGGAFTPDGMLCEDGTRLHANPNMLVAALERFATTGFMRPHAARRAGQRLVAQLRISELRAAGITETEARETVAQEMCTTVSTLERLIGRRVPK